MTDLQSLRFSEIPDLRDEWQRLFTDPQHSREVPAIDLLDDLVNLLPTSVAVRPDEAVVDEFESAWGALPGLFSKINEGLPRLDRGPGRDALRHRPTISLGDLEQAGALELLIRDADPRPGDILLRAGSGTPVVLGSSKALPRQSVAPTLTVRVSEAAPYDRYFLGAFIVSELARLSPPGDPVGIPPRSILRHCRIPRLPLEEQQRLGEQFRRLYELDESLRALARTGQTAVNAAIYGLTTGALAAPSD